MRAFIRVLAVLAALSTVGTMWFIASFVHVGGFSGLLTSGLLGIVTIVGWVVTLLAGPIAAVQLWRFREAGRRAGLVLFGYGLAYYLLGLFTLRSPEASVRQIGAAATIFAVPFVVLLLPRARTIFVISRTSQKPDPEIK